MTPDAPLNLVCVGCGGPRMATLMLNLRAGYERPSLLIAYAYCGACPRETCDAAALTAIRETVGEPGSS